jgi:glycosyltransferase involved in cell wall biosynthesis
MPRRRIVIDALQIAPHFSGVGRQLLELGAEAERSDLHGQLELRCSEEMLEVLRRAFPEGTRFHTPLRSSRPRLLRIAYQQLVAPFRDRESDVLVCLGEQAPAWGRARLVYMVNDIRRVTHPETSTGRLERLYFRFTLWAGLRRADRILTVSEFSRGEVQRLMEPKVPPVVIAQHPVPSPAPVGALADSRRFLVVGALRPYKGLETVIEALRLLKDRSEPVPEVICVGDAEGQDDYAQSLRVRAIEAGVADRFRLAGWLDQAELDRLYGTAAGTVNPSSFEGYGYALAESLARGLPTIATDLPSHKEIATDRGARFFSVGSSAALAEEMSAILSDRELADRVARDGYERARELAGLQPSLADAISAVAD